MSFAVANRFRMDNAGLQVDNGASVRGWNFGHSSGQDRRRDEPATVRGFASTVDVRGNSGIRIPHPRCEHRRRSGEPDEVQYPQPERPCRAGASEPELIERSVTAPVVETSPPSPSGRGCGARARQGEASRVEGHEVRRFS